MRTARAVAAGVALVLALGLMAQAQNQPPQFIQGTTVTIKPGAVAEYEDYLKKVNAARAKTPGSPLVNVYSVTLGGPGFTYVISVPFGKWGDREGWPAIPDLLTKTYGQAEGNKILKAGREAIVSQETAVAAYLPNASTNPKVFDPPAAYVNLARIEIRPEMGQAYATYLDKLKIAQEKSKFPFTVVRRVTAQGVAGTYTFATFYAKLSDRDQPAPGGRGAGPAAMRDAFGEAEATQLMDIPRRAIQKQENWLLTYRADLSRPRPVS
jgi:hypothetical protein